MTEADIIILTRFLRAAQAVLLLVGVLAPLIL